MQNKHVTSVMDTNLQVGSDIDCLARLANEGVHVFKSYAFVLF